MEVFHEEVIPERKDEDEMTLGEFYDKCYSMEGQYKILVVNYEINPDDLNKGGLEIDLLFTLKSAHKPSEYIKAIFADAKITAIYALERDQFLVEIDVSEEGSQD